MVRRASMMSGGSDAEISMSPSEIMSDETTQRMRIISIPHCDVLRARCRSPFGAA